MSLKNEIVLWFKDTRGYILKVPKTKYQFLDKVVVVALIVFPLMLTILYVVFGRR